MHSLALASLTWAFAITLGACDAAEPELATSPSPAATEVASATTPAPAGEQPPVVSPIRAESPEDAIRAYYAAIDAGEFARAYQLWANQGQASGQSFAEFREGFADTRSTEVSISGPVRAEGAAGTIYATVPVEVSAVLKDGAGQRFTGKYVLRRANEVPGATEEQLSWHIDSASLQPA
jgi:hypothetical protein